MRQETRWLCVQSEGGACAPPLLLHNGRDVILSVPHMQHTHKSKTILRALSYFRTASTNLHFQPCTRLSLGASVQACGDVFISRARDHSVPLLHRCPPTVTSQSLGSSGSPSDASQCLPSARLSSNQSCFAQVLVSLAQLRWFCHTC